MLGLPFPYIALLLVAILILAVLIITLAVKPLCISMLEKWAQANNYSVVSARIRFFKTGMFKYSERTKQQMVLYFSVRTVKNQMKYGYALCGHPVFGIFRGQIEIRWEANDELNKG